MFSDSSSDESLLGAAVKPTRRKRNFRERINFDFTCQGDGVCRFRLSDDHIKIIVSEVRGYIEHSTKRNYALSAEQQVRVALRYLATGSDFRVIGDAHGIDKATVSRTLHRFVDAVNVHLLPKVIKFPDMEVNARAAIRIFMENGGFPAVIGCLDGCHFDLITPKKDEHNFVNRHGRHSINGMFIGGPDLKFYYVSARWPGSVNDARVLRNSNISNKLQSGWRPIPKCVILADSAYPSNDYLITPIAVPRTVQQQKFNNAHQKTRRFIECAFGVLKQRFRCLGKQLPFDPIRSANIIRCCATLHNMVLDSCEIEAAIDLFGNSTAVDPNLEEEDSMDEHSFMENQSTRKQQLLRLF